MKKLTASLVSAVIALSSTAVLADTPTVREMNSFSHIMEIANKNRVQAAAAPSEFVIYHQDAAHKPCPPKKGKKGHKHHDKKAHGEHHGKKHHGHKHHDKKAAAPAKAEGAENTSK